MIRASRRRVLAVACALALAGIIAPRAVFPVGGGGQVPSCTALAGLQSDAMAARLDLRVGESRAGLRLRAGEEGGELAAAFRARLSEDPDGAGLSFGSGLASGPLRVIADPGAYARGMTLGDSVSIDPSLESATAVLALDSAPLSAFAAARGYRPGLAARRPGLLESPAEGGLRAAAAGFRAGDAGAAGGFALVGAVSIRRESAGGGGWRPEPPPGAAGAGLHGGIVGERRWPRGRSAFGAAGSWGRLDGPGLAFRMESEGAAGPLDLRCAAGACGSSYRGFFGELPERGFGLAIDARLALPRASSLSFSFRLESPRGTGGEGAGDGAGFSRGASFLLSLPLLSSEGRRALDLGLDLGEDSAAEPGPRGSIALRERGRGRSPEWRASAAFGLGLDPGAGDRPRQELELGLGLRGSGAPRTALGSARGLLGPPRVDLDFSLRLFPGGESRAPALAKGGLEIAFPLDRASSLIARLDLPSGGIELRPARHGERLPSLVLSAAYRSSFPLEARSSPRSSQGRSPNARSMAARAES